MWKSTSESAYLRVDGVRERRRALHAIFMKTFLASRRVRAVASRYLGTAAMFSAQTWTRSLRDTRDRVERAAPHSDPERPRIEGRLKFDFLTAGRRELLRTIYLIGLVLHPLELLGLEGVSYAICLM